MWNIPNTLTTLRIIMIPVFVVTFYLPFEWAHFSAAVIFAVAAITDWLDGYLARKLEQQTAFGAFLDPVADKLIVACALILLTDYFQAWYITFAAIVMVSREILISALREWMAELGQRGLVQVSSIGKWKTWAQLMALTGLISGEQGWVQWAALVLLYIAVVLTFWSMVVYLKAAWPQITNEK
ncbi:CDP-diacylglycerol--glycerol-3-phosphate 3-phosphatidyltransferase [Saccharobesus litoralis]|uniref:CDP-diacylglycerol--glycerol-3-phosphate 3-phosphatidyltransferase n=1 Tax=Saccharobesus litoralis TaxID=2172099 RepID=A0A2S0VV65_9ALTE|nr:CDP-diacylglycerol--glycerol-3-phosphate 3-phosphatidyltransferase [Saccharobesus litoralis]AWB68116.1 CDP-diacylglycerol--glycerol-3-phosphate 3-phosphatidyltransferase [Saccharobesus litoralis]